MKPIHILLAPDSFKHSASAEEVCNYLRAGLKQVDASFFIRSFPMADGGEGTTEALVAATDGTWITSEAHDPLMRPIEVRYGITGDGVTAIIEMAAASGIERLHVNELNPLLATTFGTGELIKHALSQGCTEIIIGLGGSATVDGGVGMCQALGGCFFAADGRKLLPGDTPLQAIDHFEVESVAHELRNIRVMGACDVRNPLVGPKGAAQFFAPQKGADESAVFLLEQGMKDLYEKVNKNARCNLFTLPGAGAAGGLGAGIVAFLNGELTPGFDLIASRAHLSLAIEQADVVITGEGRIDRQTGYGKTPAGVANLAHKYNKKVIGIAGSLAPGHELLYAQGFDLLLSIAQGPATTAWMQENTPELITNTGIKIARMLNLGIR